MRKTYFLLSIFYSLFFLALPQKTFAQTRGFGAGEVAGPTGDVATIKGLEAIFSNVVVVILALAGIALFIMIISGGFRYLTAGGNPDNAQAAKQTLTYAFIGFVVLVAAYLILNLIEQFTGVRLSVFQITQ